uniref:Putative capsid n=1 Tax=Linepithema humile qinvirus-like virus 1 TaxID=2259782 RepID=A0A2Z4Z3S8_9VIRU|nr:putative capsid [Linepithema humile qinvirus-like virus 1]
MSMTVNLPSINGEIEAGITVGVDATLPDDQKLPIFYMKNEPATLEQIKQNAVCWAFTQFTDVVASEIISNGVAAMMDLGLVTYTGKIPSIVADGDWFHTSHSVELTEDLSKSIPKVVTKEAMMKSVTMAVATKANFWLMNHHTGQGAVAGYVKKVLDVFYPGHVNDQVVSAAHNLGHFTSTLEVLKMAGMAGLSPVKPIMKADNSVLTLSQDAKLSFMSMPAGTHSLAIGYESAKSLVSSVYAPFCPNVTEFSLLPDQKKEVMTAPSSFHMGASYLTGVSSGDYDDNFMTHYLGSLGTFINVLYKNSTLAKSPHMTPAKVESYDDYDAEWKALLVSMQQVQAAASGKVAEEHMEALQVLSGEALDELSKSFKATAMEPQAGTSSPPLN